MSEYDLEDVNGWLLFYAVIRIGLAAIALLPVGAGLLGAPISLHYLYLFPVFTGLAAGAGIVRTSSWTIPVVAVDMAVNLAFLAVAAFQNGLRSPIVLLGEGIQLAIFYAWFEYFRTSKRVQNTLGRNLFANISGKEDLLTSSER
jgi:hypothetical protein